jgi:hypothetical protein
MVAGMCLFALCATLAWHPLAIAPFRLAVGLEAPGSWCDVPWTALAAFIAIESAFDPTAVLEWRRRSCLSRSHSPFESIRSRLLEVIGALCVLNDSHPGDSRQRHFICCLPFVRLPFTFGL